MKVLRKGGWKGGKSNYVIQTVYSVQQYSVYIEYN